MQACYGKWPSTNGSGAPGEESTVGPECQIDPWGDHLSKKCMNIFSTLIYSVISVTILVIVNIFTTILIFVWYDSNLFFYAYWYSEYSCERSSGNINILNIHLSNHLEILIFWISAPGDADKISIFFSAWFNKY